jgi:peptidoglycan biosynthesis protein MviN/MurJ (putative lipid II flippase)
MDERSKFLFGFIAMCIAVGLSLQITVLVMVFGHMPGLRRALPVEAIVGFVLLYWWIRRSKGRLPNPSKTEMAKAARNARNLGVFFIAAPMLGYLLRGSEYLALPYGLGFIIPIVPLMLAIYFLRLSARLRKASGGEATRRTTPEA